jgi:copper chaperone CopZ
MLITLSGIAGIAICYLDPFSKPREATLLVEGMCCELRAGDAAQELRKVAGVTATRQSIPERSISITVQGSAPVLHASLWNAARKAKVRPVKMIVDGRVIAQEND